MRMASASECTSAHTTTNLSLPTLDTMSVLRRATDIRLATSRATCSAVDVPNCWLTFLPAVETRRTTPPGSCRRAGLPANARCSWSSSSARLGGSANSSGTASTAGGAAATAGGASWAWAVISSMTRPSRWFSTARARWVSAFRTVCTNAWGTSGFTRRPSSCDDAARALSSEAKPVSSRTGASGSTSLSRWARSTPVWSASWWSTTTAAGRCRPCSVNASFGSDATNTSMPAPLSTDARLSLVAWSSSTTSTESSTTLGWNADNGRPPYKLQVGRAQLPPSEHRLTVMIHPRPQHSVPTHLRVGRYPVSGNDQASHHSSREVNVGISVATGMAAIYPRPVPR